MNGNGLRGAANAPSQMASVSYVFCLYIAGASPRSTEALASIKAICERYIPDRYALDVIDIYQQPALAQQDQIEVAPTLVKKFPLPEGRLVGDLTNQKRVLARLDVLNAG